MQLLDGPVGRGPFHVVVLGKLSLGGELVARAEAPLDDVGAKVVCDLTVRGAVTATVERNHGQTSF